MNALFSLLYAFALTVLVECGLALLFKSKRLVYTVFLCNLLTNPLLNFILILYYHFISRRYYWRLVAILEICVVVGEALLIKLMMKYTFKKALTLSLLFNACSFGVGFFIGLRMV